MKKMFLIDFTVCAVLVLAVAFSSITTKPACGMPCASKAATKCPITVNGVQGTTENELFRFNGFYYKL